jgi:hypothetical protein
MSFKDKTMWLGAVGASLLWCAQGYSEELVLKPFPAPPPLEADVPASARLVVPQTLKIEPDAAALCAAAEARGEPLPLGCAEQKLRDAAKTPPVTNTPPLDARSTETKIGLANQAAVKQQFGKNYGVSTKPFRPVRTYTSPVRTAPPPPPAPGATPPEPPRGILNR